MKISKKKVLFFLVFIEFVICILIVNTLYQKIQYKRKVNSVEIGKIKKDNLIFSKEEDFQYYYTLEASSIFRDNPGWENYGEIVYAYNKDGLKDRFDYTVQKPPHTFRIITLGDSFTYAYFIKTEHSWPEQLEEIFKTKSTGLCSLQKVEVINLGMNGFDVAYIVKRYKDLGDKYNPDLIIWLESASGFSRINEITTPYLEDCQKKFVGPEISSNDTFMPCLINAYDRLEEDHSYLEIDNYIISYLQDFFSTVDAKKVIFFSFEASLLNERDTQSLARWKKSINDLNFFQILPDLNKLEQNLPDDYHPNIEGHKTIAETIFNYLTENEADYCSEAIN